MKEMATNSDKGQREGCFWKIGVCQTAKNGLYFIQFKQRLLFQNNCHILKLWLLSDSRFSQISVSANRPNFIWNPISCKKVANTSNLSYTIWAVLKKGICQLAKHGWILEFLNVLRFKIKIDLESNLYLKFRWSMVPLVCIGPWPLL
jgi:hypothetical protein